MEVVEVVRRWLALLVSGALARREKLHRAHLGDVESIPCCPMDEKRTPRGFGKCHGEVALLGVVVPLQFQARAAGQVIDVPGRKERALLAFLAMPPGEPRSRDRLCGLLWGDRGDKQAHDRSCRSEWHRQTIVEIANGSAFRMGDLGIRG